MKWGRAFVDCPACPLRLLPLYPTRCAPSRPPPSRPPPSRPPPSRLPPCSVLLVADDLGGPNGTAGARLGAVEVRDVVLRHPRLGGLVVSEP